MELKCRNVNDGFINLVKVFAGKADDVDIVRRTSRYGNVLMIEEPVTVTYTHPMERVLFNSARDANPFSLLYESLWCLAGRNDVAPLAYYTKRMIEFSDDGRTLNGAYGKRWREFVRDRYSCTYCEPEYVSMTGDPCVDQLKVIIDHLRAKPDSRRAVLQMWNVEDDLLKVNTGLDICCNLSVCFSVRDEVCKRCGGPGCYQCDRGEGSYLGTNRKVLDITVFNRSNDLIWGMLGVNVVQFSILQEYVAAHLGVEVGVYHQVTNNLHVYTKNWEPDKWLDDTKSQDLYYGDTKTVPLVSDPSTFDHEVAQFVERNSGGDSYSPCAWKEPFLDKVAQPMMTAFRAHKEKWGGGVHMWLNMITADDWRMAARGWIERRQKK